MKKVLILSYYSCMPGACQAEWIDDKIDSLLKSGHDIFLISSICSRSHAEKNVRHWRVPSISLIDFQDEIQRIKMQGDRIQFSTYFMWPVSFTAGWIVDAIQFIVTKGVGEGRWSWTLTSSISALLMALKFKPGIILSTGGPGSAHLAGIIVSKLTSTPLVVELQDPLSGGDIGRNEQVRGWLYVIEKLIVASADKIVYVTKEAANFAARQFDSPKIFYVYPGAKNFGITISKLRRNPKESFKIIHLGSLYSTRNFRTIIAAIDILINSGKISPNGIELINLGHVSAELSNEIRLKHYVKVCPLLPRVEALHIAAKCDLTLLIQNNDERSNVTIPYKTYDYLNLNTPILALLNSNELSELLTSYGHIALPVTDVAAITQNLALLLEGKLYKDLPTNLEINAVTQACLLLELPNLILKS